MAKSSCYPSMKQFPKIFRFIPDYHRYLIRLSDFPLLFVGFFSGVMLTGIILQSIFLYNNLQKLQAIGVKRSALEDQAQILSNLTKSYPSYRDLYLQVAVIEYRLGNTTQAKAYADRALVIDPNFQAAIDLESKLQ